MNASDEIEIISELESLTKQQLKDTLAVMSLAIFYEETAKKMNDLSKAGLPIKLLAFIDTYLMIQRDCRFIVNSVTEVLMEKINDGN